MVNSRLFFWILANLILLQQVIQSQDHLFQDDAFGEENILKRMNLVNEYFQKNEWKKVDRNWKRATYYTGLMASYKVTSDEKFLVQARQWASKHGWKTGTEWIYPANRMACVQTYLQLYFIENDENKIRNARKVMDNKVNITKPALIQGWDYVDALYVGTPAYFMMSRATGDKKYASYGHRMFNDVVGDLFNPQYALFYRDQKAKSEKSPDGLPVFWSRGNGWAIAAIPRIVENMPEAFPDTLYYPELIKKMAASLKNCQREDGFWPVNLADPDHFEGPESSGTAFFTYALVWGINNKHLDKETYEPVIYKAWKALYNAVNSEGKILWGQTEARAPGRVDRSDSDEFVSGAFLLAASEILNFIRKRGH